MGNKIPTVEVKISSLSGKIHFSLVSCSNLDAKFIEIFRRDEEAIILAAASKLVTGEFCYRAGFHFNLLPRPLLFNSIIAQNHNVISSVEILSYMCIYSQLSNKPTGGWF